MTIRTCGIQASGSIELFFYGELPAAERLALDQHLKSCGECRSLLDELGLIRAALASRPDVASPPGGDWSAFMTRLASAIKSDTPAVVAFEPKALARSARRSIAPYLAMAALLALVTMSVLYVSQRTRERDTGAGASPPPVQAASQPTPGRAARDSALAALSEEHFKRSKLVVLGLTTKDPSAAAPDWKYERELASTLLTDTRLYRQAAEERGMNGIAGVMRDLELVLLQTSMSEAPDSSSLEQIQRLIRRRDLVTKMDVVNSAGLVP